MFRNSGDPPGLSDVLRAQEGVVSAASALGWMSREELRWRLASGRWQRLCHGIVVAHSGPLTQQQRLWGALVRAGEGAVLAGLTAASLDGLEGFSGSDHAPHPIHLLVPASRSVRRRTPGFPVAVHYSTALGTADVHPLREPRRTRVARSLVDAAAWMGSDRGAQAVLAAGVQQRLVRPEPDRQAARRDAAGRRRWLDAVWEPARVILEVDGIHHLDAAQYWADMDRSNDVTLGGYRILRFPAFVVRYQPGYVAGKIRMALRGDGGRFEITA